MKTAGIVCEFNPLHNGHKYLIDKTRELGATHIVCAMSGNFVQRGEPAYIDKWKRAELAIKCGADLVVENLVPWAVSSAEDFARGSIQLLNKIGIDFLAFGNEAENNICFDELKKAVENESVINDLKVLMQSGLSYPTALGKSIEKHFGREYAKVVSLPNNILGLEYVKRLDTDINYYPIKRKGVMHDQKSSSGEFMSATSIRNLSSIDEAKDFIPEEVYNELKDYQSKGFLYNANKKFETIALSALRTISIEEMKKYVSDEKGLAERIYNSTKKSESLAELYLNVKSKNYTMARIRREILNILLQIPKDVSKQCPGFIKVMASNSKGLEVLSNYKGDIPVITKYSEVKKLDSFSKEIYDIQIRSSDLYCLMTEKNRACSMEQTSSMIIIK